jgi:hypothetical protein
MLDRLIARPRAAFSVCAGAGYLVILALSLFFQLQVNRLEFHANYCARDWFQGVRDPAIDSYFHSHEGLVFDDLSGWKHGRAELPPLTNAKALVNPIGIAKLEHALRTSCLQGNYLLFPD